MTVNYDLGKLSITVAGDGFVLGASRLGVDHLGARSLTELDVSDQLTSISISNSRSVDSGMWVSQDATTCTVTARFEDAPNLFRGQSLIVNYRGEELFSGRVLNAKRAVSVDPKTPGNRKWVVSMLATDTSERSVGFRISTVGLPEATLDQAIVDRVPYVSRVEISPSVLDRIRTFRMAAGHDASITVKTLFEQVAKIGSCIVQSTAAEPSVIRLSGYDDGIHWTLRDDEYPSYAQSSFTEEASGASGVEVTPATAEDVDGDVTGRVQVTALARNDLAESLDIPVSQQAAQAVANTLPVTSALVETLEATSLPFDERLDLSGLPTSLTLWLDAQPRTALVLAVRHTITPRFWSIDLGLAPDYLGSRLGAAVPAPVTEVSVLGSVVSWTDSPTAVEYVVTAKAIVWPQHPNDGTPTVVHAGIGSLDIATAVGSGTWRVTVWALPADDTLFSGPVTTTVEV